MPKNGSQSHVTTNCLASSLTLQVEVDALRICLSLSIEQNEKGREWGGSGRGRLRCSWALWRALRFAFAKVWQRKTITLARLGFFFAAASFYCNHISHLWQTVLVIVTSEVGSQSPSPSPTLPCLLPQVEQIKRMQSSFSWQCFLTHTVQEVAEGTKRCPNIFYTFL